MQAQDLHAEHAGLPEVQNFQYSATGMHACAGPSYFFVGVGDHIRVSFAAKKSLVIIGGSQNLQFLDESVRALALRTMQSDPCMAVA